MSTVNTPPEPKGFNEFAVRVEHGLVTRVSGSGERGDILWVHGLGESGLGFEGLITHPRLSGFRHWVPDLQGYGRSPWPNKPLLLEQHAERLAAFLTERPTILVGHSMGGVIGQMLCERSPEQIRAFVNVEGNLSLGDCTVSARAAAHSAQGFLQHGFAQLCEEIYLDGQEDLALRTFYPSLRLCDPATYHQNSLELVELSREEKLAARFGALDLPKIYLHGSPRGTGLHSLSLLQKAGGSSRAVPDAGHWPFLDQPETFLDRLTQFLGQLSAIPSR